VFDFKAIYSRRKDIPVVPEELKDDQEIQRAIANLDIVCRCGSMKEFKGESMGEKNYPKTKVLVGGKRKMRCKKCTGCLAPKCDPETAVAVTETALQAAEPAKPVEIEAYISDTDTVQVFICVVAKLDRDHLNIKLH
jgi:hypothetical protein